MAETCATCKYFHEMPGYGKCLAKSPSCDGWPSVTPDCWCGEHSSIAQHETSRPVLEDAENLAKYRKMNQAKNELITRLIYALSSKEDCINTNICEFIEGKLNMTDDDAYDLVRECGIHTRLTVRELTYWSMK